MSATERRRGGGIDPATLAMGLGLACLLLLGGLFWAGLHLGQLINPAEPPLPSENPVVLPIYLARGMVPISTTDEVCLGVLAVILAVLAVLAARVVLRRRKPNRSIDAAARHMARGKELQRFTKATATATANRIAPMALAIGVYLGVTVAGRTALYAGWEDGEVDIWGPRTGKTASRVIPTILGAPGAVLATSNRRDLVDLTRGVRAMAGAVYVFDPQRIIGEQPTFYWDPLSYVLSGPQGPEVKAKELANLFHAATTPPDASSDKFFDPKGKALLGHLLLAAAISGRTLVEVYRWVNREKDSEPARLLRDKGYPASAEFVEGIIGSPDKQRGGIYATAEVCITWMTNRAAVEWVTPQPGRDPFDPSNFALTSDTLYLVSREGSGSLAPLTTALAWATLEAAEHTATEAGGRLPIPMVAALDEVANTAPMPGLPGLYSHFGGRSIFLLTILQSWKQGEDAFGPRGMAKLWSAATVRIYGGGNAEVGFLDELRRLTGTYRPQQVSTGSSRSGHSTNYSEGSDDILDVADLAALGFTNGRKRVLLVPTGSRPTLLEPQPYFDGPWAGEIEMSRLEHEPAAVGSAPVVNPEPDVAPAGDAWRDR